MSGHWEGKKLSSAHKNAISKGMKKASKEGRLKSPSEECTSKGLKAMKNLTKEQMERRSKNTSKAMKGRPQRLDAVTGAHKDNLHAKYWSVRSPDRKVYTFKNLNQFIRDNEHLFSKDDLQWKNSACRASIGIRKLAMINKNTGNPYALSWKGWTDLELLDEND